MCKYIKKMYKEFISKEGRPVPLFAKYEIRKHIISCKGKVVDCNKEIRKIFNDIKNNRLRRSIIVKMS